MREQRKVVTVLFCDLVGSTALGESTDPEALRAQLARTFADLRSVVERHGGTVEKFVGDAVMAVFGIPTAHEDDALRAVRAATEMRGVISAQGLDARMGVNTGEVVVGGEGETLVTGDAVNVAARLEQSAAPGETLIGEQTRSLVRDAVVVEPVEPLELRGKAEPVLAHRLVDIVGDEPIVRRLATPLVGRERERRRLWRDYEDAVADRTSRLFTLLGPAGIGKSRLVADFLQRVGGDADVLRGRCLSYGEGITYWPLVEMLEPLGIDPAAVVSTPEETRVAFRRLLEDRAAERPQVVVVDDLQWAEPLFVDLVEHVADLSRGVPLFLLCIARTELLDTRRDWGGGKLNATSLLLEPLPEAERQELIDSLLGSAMLDDETRSRIAEASAGYPLYVEEMLAMVRDDGGSAVAVPPTIQALLQARIDSLDFDVRAVLECGAVEGEVFHRGAVEELVPHDVRGSLDAHLASLVRKELIWPDRSLTPGEDAYRFRHLLVREVAYGSMTKGLRAELHERFADWLEERSSHSAFELDEILGYHLAQASQLLAELGPLDARGTALAERAARRLTTAGERASDRGDSLAAAALLRQAAATLPAEHPARAPIGALLGSALIRLGEFEAARAAVDEAAALARASSDRVTLAHAELVLGDVRSRTDPTMSSDERLADALRVASELEGLGDTATLGLAYRTVAMVNFFLGRAAEGEVGAEKAIALARSAGDVVGERAALSAMLRPVAWGPRSAVDGLRLCADILEREDLTVGLRVHASQVRSLLAAMAGELELARSAGGEAFALAEEFGLALPRGLAAMDIGYGYRVIGDLEAAERVLRFAHQLLAAIGETGSRATLGPELADVLYLTGRDAEAAALVEESRALASADDPDAQSRWRGVMARILSSRGEHDEAERLAREAVTVLDATDFVPLKAEIFDALGEVLARVGRTEEAVSAIGQAITFHEQKGNVVSAARSRAVIDGLRSARPS